MDHESEPTRRASRSALGARARRSRSSRARTGRHRTRRVLAGWTAVGLLVLAGPVGLVFAAVSDSTSTGRTAVESAELPADDDLGAIGGQVWDDLDHDGLRDPGEPGVDGVTVALLDDGGTPLESEVTTNSGPLAGTYRFDGLVAATYGLQASGLPPGHVFTVAGGDSFADPADGRSGPVDLGAGEERTDLHAGIWAPDPSIALEVRAQGQDADAPPGPSVPVGATVDFDHLVTNTGDEALEGLAVTDDQGLTVACPQATVAVGETVACSASTTAQPGAHVNEGTATATGQVSGTAVTASDLAHHTGVSALLDVEVQVNGADADAAADAEEVRVGDPVAFTYVVANTGSEGVAAIAVDDSTYGTVTCPATELAPGETMACDGFDDLASAGLHTTVATAEGTSQVGGEAVGDTDPASYVGRDPAVTLLKEVRDPGTGAYVDGDADGGTPGSNDGAVPTYQQGATAAFRFQVVNAGDTAVTDVQLADDHCDAPPALAGGDGAPTGVLDVGETWFFTCSVAGLTSPFTNTATVSGTTTVGPPAGNGASERAAVEVVGPPGVAITKEVQRADGSWAADATIDEGGTARFRLRVDNVGQAPLVGIEVGDAAVPACARSFPGPLAVGASTPAWTCDEAAVTAGFTNRATVTASSSAGGAAVHAEAEATVHVRTVIEQDLSLEKDLVAHSPGEATFRLTVTNHGPGAAPGPITVVDDLPVGLSLSSASGAGWSCSAAGQAVTCERAAGLADGASSSVLLEVAVAEGTGRVTNTASLGGADADAGNDDDTAVLDAATGGPGGPGDPGEPAGPGSGGSGTGGAGGGRGPIAFTGSDVLGLVLVALALVGAGTTLLVATRRRRAAALHP